MSSGQHIFHGATRVAVSLMAPLMYGFLYILSVVEYIALLQAIVGLPRLRRASAARQVTWASPERTGRLKGGRHRAGQVARSEDFYRCRTTSESMVRVPTDKQVSVGSRVILPGRVTQCCRPSEKVMTAADR